MSMERAFFAELAMVGLMASIGLADEPSTGATALHLIGIEIGTISEVEHGFSLS